jgi:tetratricopeptide (TPR) repeat protein
MVWCGLAKQPATAMILHIRSHAPRRGRRFAWVWRHAAALLLVWLPMAADGAQVRRPEPKTQEPSADIARIDSLLAEAARLASAVVHRADLAVALCREAQRLAARAGDPMRAARASAILGRAFVQMDRPAEATAALTAAVSGAALYGDTAVEAEALRVLGNLYIVQARYEAATTTLERVLALGRGLGDSLVVVRALNSLSAAAWERGRLPDAVTYGRLATAEVDRAIARAEPLAPNILFAAPFNYAKALANSGDYLAAAPLFERAFAEARRHDNVGAQHHVLFDTAQWYQAQGDLDRAHRYFQRALEQSRLVVDTRYAEAESRCGLASVVEAQGAPARAVELYLTCVSLFEAMKLENELPTALASLARAQSKAGQKAQARQSVDRALARARGADQPQGMVAAWLERGRQSLAAGSLAEAHQDYQAAAELARKYAILPLAPTALVGLAAVARAQGDLAGAERWLRASTSAIERIRGRIVSIGQRAAFAEAAHTTFSALANVLAERHRRDPTAGHDREAFGAVEQERTRNLAAALTGEAPGTRDRAEQGEHGQVAQRLAEIQIALASPGTTGARRTGLIAALDDAERQLDAVTAVARGARDGSGAATHDVTTLQGVLHTDEVFVEYVIAEGSALAFVVRRDDFALVPLALPAEFAERVRVFGHLLAGADGRDAETVGRVLSDALLTAVLARAGPEPRTLIIAAAGDAAKVPFAALPDPAQRRVAVPLLQRFAIGYVPSLSALRLLRTAPRTIASRDLMAIADAAHAEASPAADGIAPALLRAALPYSRDEVRYIAPMARGAADVLMGATASETALKALPIDQFKVLHFATHTVLDPQVPARSAIALASPDPGLEDGLLQGREVYGFRLAADLVVLSACRSAAGQSSSAEGLHSLASAFLYAGARSVLGTSWDVEDRASAALVQRVYDRVAAGDTIGVALAAAQRGAGRGAPYAHSAEWAAFVLVGDPSARPDLAVPSFWVRWSREEWAALLILIAGIAALAAVAARKHFAHA